MIALYVRVSTREQAREGYSIEEQIERLKKYCEAHGRSDYKVYVDAGFSGANTNRPELQKMIQDSEEGLLEKVIVYKLDRLSRSQKDTLELIEDVFLKNEVDFESMSERFDTATSFGKAMVGLLAVFAQLEREQIKERMSMGREGRAKLGKWHGGGWVPIGYDYVDDELIINDYEAMQVKEAFELYLQGYNYRAIDRIFENKGYKYKYGEWDDKRVQRTLSNDIYIGNIKHDGEIYKGLHTPLVDEETFRKVQNLMLWRRGKFVANIEGRNSTYLGGLIMCGCCGAKYAVSKNSGNKNKPYIYYSCYSRRKQNKKMVLDPNCKNKSWRVEKLDQIVFGEISKLQMDPDYVMELKSEKDLEKERNTKVKILRRELKKLDEQRARFMNLYGVGDFTAEELQEHIRPLSERRGRILEEVEELEGERPQMDSTAVSEVVKNFSDILKKGEYQEIRLVIESLIKYIEINGEDITIHWRFT